jgi:hypothetical protein
MAWLSSIGTVGAFQSDMDLSDSELRQRAAADRREVDSPIQVEAAMWSKLASSI